MADELKGKIIAVDFDSTIAHYKKFKGHDNFGKLITGADWALGKFKEFGATIIIHSCRSNTEGMKKYLEENKIPYDYINFSPRNGEFQLNGKKVAADIYIDDKGVCFRGQWSDTFRVVMNFRPWEKSIAGTDSVTLTHGL